MINMWSIFKGTRAQNFLLGGSYLKYNLDMSVSDEMWYWMTDSKKYNDNIIRYIKMHKTEVNLFSVPRTSEWIPLILNCVLEIVLACAKFSSNFQMIHVP